MKIKKCPFCGGNAMLNQNYSEKNNTYFVYMRCLICGAQSKTFASQRDVSDDDNSPAIYRALSAWNNRIEE